ncbi:MAG: alpha-L-fucosidase [Kiritimatiellae bacterium]|nr:alpha-L-fucosidase [Kiritimatiellia bacterium]
MSDTAWFTEARYGMFIHWGAYSVAGRGEWVMNRERIPYSEYVEKYVRNFKAERYDPAGWAALAARAGMKYMVLTTRHHDGFALWDTRTSDFNAAKMGPKRDLLKPYVEAARAAGLKVGFYFSGADWRHEDYPTAYARDWPKSQEWRDEESRKRFIRYYRAQLEELMSNYGPIDILWYDGCIPGPFDGEAANARVKELQPGILINNRNGPPFDFTCQEQSLKPKDGVWEACLTLNDNWGYHAGDNNWKDAREVIRMLVTAAAKGGNLLLNVGPKADGTLPEESVRILEQAGEWLARNRAFLPDSPRSPFAYNNCGILTWRGRTVYAHLFKAPGPEYCLAEIKNKVLAARWLATGESIPFEQNGARLFFRHIPFPLPDPIAATIAIEVEGVPEPVTEQKTFWVPE